MIFKKNKLFKKIGDNKFLVNVLGVIFNPKTRKILIVRRENDLHIKKLTWCFPGGKVKYDENLEETLKKEIKKKTGLTIESLGTIFARIHPENKEFISIFYLCEVINGEEKASDTIKEIKWVDPTEIEKYFKTSYHPKLKEYIENLK
ncbi:MAG TPA: NUDIX hydrolase [Candidatus Paceibacterota bacterium]|nr:NUDIX hydrolase [Candidatus Paceibacterota bacterium]